MGPGPRRRPACALPALHAFQLRTLVYGDHAVDLAVRMGMVLARELALL